MADFEDTFTDTAGTQVESHTPNIGAGWTLLTNGYVIDSAGTAAEKEADTSAMLCAGISGEDYEVQADVLVNGADNRHGVIGRVTDASNGLTCRIKGSGNEFRMDKHVAGVQTTIATSTADTISLSTYYTIKLVVAGTGSGQNFDGYFNGVQRLDPAAPNNAVLDTGDPGIGLVAGGLGGAGNLIDNLSVTLTAAFKQGVLFRGS